ncbi:MAG: hypothetical protein MUE53_03915 [Chitinophagales bacterium]|jgi:hypothetical protein|nr:hypothetical protein [Chitinophagales bacterium]
MRLSLLRKYASFSIAIFGFVYLSILTVDSIQKIYKHHTSDLICLESDAEAADTNADQNLEPFLPSDYSLNRFDLFSLISNKNAFTFCKNSHSYRYNIPIYLFIEDFRI